MNWTRCRRVRDALCARLLLPRELAGVAVLHAAHGLVPVHDARRRAAVVNHSELAVAAAVLVHDVVALRRENVRVEEVVVEVRDDHTSLAHRERLLARGVRAVEVASVRLRSFFIDHTHQEGAVVGHVFFARPIPSKFATSVNHHDGRPIRESRPRLDVMLVPDVVLA